MRFSVLFFYIKIDTGYKTDHVSLTKLPIKLCPKLHVHCKVLYSHFNSGSAFSFNLVDCHSTFMM